MPYEVSIKCAAEGRGERITEEGEHSSRCNCARIVIGFFLLSIRMRALKPTLMLPGMVRGAEPGKEAHAASTVPCMYCHSGKESGMMDCTSCHMDLIGHESRYTGGDCKRCHHLPHGYHIPPAGGFNLTTNSTDTGEMAAHKTFVMNAISNPDMEDANEAGIACHTHVPVKINWTHRVSLEFTCTPTESLPPTHFNVTDWASNGTTYVTV